MEICPIDPVAHWITRYGCVAWDIVRSWSSAMSRTLEVPRRTAPATSIAFRHRDLDQRGPSPGAGDVGRHGDLDEVPAPLPRGVDGRRRAARRCRPPEPRRRHVRRVEG